MFTEARRYPRVKLCSRCWLESGNVTLYVPLRNLSEGGAFLNTGVPLKPGARAALRFRLSERHGTELRVDAIVVWARDIAQASGDVQPGMGLKFVSMRDADVDVVRGFVERKLAPL